MACLIAIISENKTLYNAAKHRYLLCLLKKTRQFDIINTIILQRGDIV